ncbi:hypothetical protein [Kingella negevensis]|uniref:hypothetical protein n=1 Tax=Kingella negevensis TaxID=1522312 RepID=UPI00050A22AB|nr:hypothetical protein [Kingella negevensis]MDK4689106.1 hypothetical protein [Kingella negevensis]WII90689.1 hypothetical protein QEO93_09750 [Kingella negevensis]
MNTLKQWYRRLFGEIRYLSYIFYFFTTYGLIEKIILSEQPIIRSVVAIILSIAFYFYYKGGARKRDKLQEMTKKSLIGEEILLAITSVWFLSVIYETALKTWENPAPFICFIVALVCGIGILQLKDRIKKKDNAPTLKENLKNNL